MCFSSIQVNILHLQKDVLILFSFGCFFSSAVIVIYLTDVFNMLFPCDSSLFTEKDICHWATASVVVADGYAVLAFLRSLHHSLLMGSFVSKFCSPFLKQHNVWYSVYIIYFIHHIRTGPLHTVTSGQITVTVSSHQFQMQGTKTQAKRWLTVMHRTQSIANTPAKTVNT